MDDDQLEAAIATDHDLVMDDVRERAGQPPSKARQFEYRARALRLSRDRMHPTGALLRFSLESEAALLDAARRAYAGEDVDVLFIGERIERSGTTGGLAEVVQLPNTTAGARPKIYGLAAVYDEWTTICSVAEGYFRERVARGAFDESIASGEKILSYWQHGRDPLLGPRPLGPLTLRSDQRGLHYEVEVLPHASLEYPVEACRAGLCGSSFAFETKADDADEWRQPAYPTRHNPEMIPERTLRNVRLRECGPVVSAAYPGATAGVRNAQRDDRADNLYRNPAARAAVLRRIALDNIN
jgi:phage head maturation protease